MKAYFKKGKVLSVMVACCIMFFATLGAIIFNDGNINSNKSVGAVSALTIEESVEKSETDSFADLDDFESVEAATINYLDQQWYYVFNGQTGITRDQIESIKFVSGSSVPTGFVSSQYVNVGSSGMAVKEKDPRVKVYWVKDGSYYDLAFTASGPIVAHQGGCFQLFYGLTSLTTINFKV